MTQEQKAKAYDKVREKIAIRFGSNVADEIFSQFEMSEDERIRKELIFYLRYQHSISENFEDIGKWLAWLEKQGDKSFNYENANIQQDDFAPKSQRMVSAEAKEALYGKPVWSEEDEKMYLSIMSVLLSTIGTDKTGFTVTREMNWLKSIKDRVQPQPKQEWSEEDERMLNHIIGYLHSGDDSQTGIDWLKSLKERMGG